jgi:hypothetical protein
MKKFYLWFLRYYLILTHCKCLFLRNKLYTARGVWLSTRPSSGTEAGPPDSVASSDNDALSGQIGVRLKIDHDRLSSNCYEWLRNDHKGGKGAKAVEGGTTCIKCHEGEEKALGDKLVLAGPLEPTPVKGKNGSIDLKVQVAYDAKVAYFRFQWKTQNAYPGTEHQYLPFDGKEWKVYGYPKLDKVVQEGKQPGIYEDRMNIMIDDGKVPGFSRQGCWLTCHDGQRDMPKQFTKEEAASSTLLNAIKKSDVRKYLPATRTDPADWKFGKSLDEIAKIKAASGFVDLIQ